MYIKDGYEADTGDIVCSACITPEEMRAFRPIAATEESEYRHECIYCGARIRTTVRCHKDDPSWWGPCECAACDPEEEAACTK